MSTEPSRSGKEMGRRPLIITGGYVWGVVLQHRAK
jgi:hypothetical protein